MDGSWLRLDLKKIENCKKIKFFGSDGFFAGFLPGRRPSLYFVQKLLSKMKKYSNYNEMIVKQVIKMVIVIVENPRYITES